MFGIPDAELTQRKQYVARVRREVQVGRPFLPHTYTAAHRTFPKAGQPRRARGAPRAVSPLGARGRRRCG
jgi:hypothetical protein